MMAAINETVIIAGCEVRPGDLVIGDADGLVVLSEDDLRSHIDAAETRLDQEAQWARRLASGETVSSVFDVAKEHPVRCMRYPYEMNKLNG